MELEVREDDTDTAQAGDSNDGGDNNNCREAPGGGTAVAGGGFLLSLAGRPLFLVSLCETAVAGTFAAFLRPFLFVIFPLIVNNRILSEQKRRKRKMKQS